MLFNSCIQQRRRVSPPRCSFTYVRVLYIRGICICIMWNVFSVRIQSFDSIRNFCMNNIDSIFIWGILIEVEFLHGSQFELEIKKNLITSHVNWDNFQILNNHIQTFIFFFNSKPSTQRWPLFLSGIYNVNCRGTRLFQLCPRETSPCNNRPFVSRGTRSFRVFGESSPSHLLLIFVSELYSVDVCSGMIDSGRLSDSMVLIWLLYRVLRTIFAFGLRFVVS